MVQAWETGGLAQRSLAESGDGTKRRLCGGLPTLRGGLLGLQGRYSGSSVLSDEHITMPITVGIPRSKHSGEPALHVKQVL